jgi:hypothetical protein
MARTTHERCPSNNPSMGWRFRAPSLPADSRAAGAACFGASCEGGDLGSCEGGDLGKCRIGFRLSNRLNAENS